MDGTADGGLGPCTMDRNDTLQIDLGSGSPPSSFQGTINYAFSVASGWNCADQLASAGGQYATLPCTVTYSMTATRQYAPRAAAPRSRPAREDARPAREK